MKDTDQTPLPRLNKHLALTLGVSRREADALIAGGRVSLNGTVAELWQRVDEDDTVALDGKPLTKGKADLLYIAFNKPVGYVTSRRQQGTSPTIYSVIPQKYHHLKPVGRLDRDSSGLLLLTNDGDFAHSMTHPSFRKAKRYEVRLDTPLAPLHQQMISDHGVQLPDGTSRFTVTRHERAGKPTDPPMYEVIMSEGRNRQIRRTFAALGYTVTQLHRTDFGPYALGDLAEGTFTDVRP